MTKMPLPPGFAAAVQQPAPKSSRPPRLEQPAPKPDTVVGSDETSLILKRCLLPQHSDDPNILKFIASYLICRDVKQASKEAGITSRDGENLKRRPDIHEAIRQITEKAVLKHGFDASEVVERVKEISRIDPLDLENPDGTFKHLRDIPPETRRAIKKFKAKNTYEFDPNGMRVCNGQIIEVEFWDKMKAVELLGREKDTFKETKTIKHDLSTNMSSLLLESKKLAEEHVQNLRDVSNHPQIEHKSVGEIIETTATEPHNEED